MVNIGNEWDEIIGGEFEKPYFRELQNKVDMAMAGSTRQRISRKELGEIPIPVFPSKEEQDTIASILSDMDAEISALEQKLAKYKKLKQGMMQQLLTGKIRLI